jgi:5-methylcytosine-specific restriction endonuclease McrA
MSSAERSRRYNGTAKAAARDKRYAESNKEALAERNRKNRAANPGYALDWQRANPEKVQQYARAWEKRNPEQALEMKRRSNLKRKRLLAGAPTDDHTRFEIFERDSWICRIDDCRCPAGRRIDRLAPHHTQWSGTIDHIMPISIGGGHTRENVRAAHYSCNASRSNRTA